MPLLNWVETLIKAVPDSHRHGADDHFIQRVCSKSEIISVLILCVQIEAILRELEEREAAPSETLLREANCRASVVAPLIPSSLSCADQVSFLLRRLTSIGN